MLSNQSIIHKFEQSMIDSGLKESTVEKHLINVSFFVTHYLENAMDCDAVEGIKFVSTFFDDWFVRKTTWATQNGIKENITSLKKFYSFLSKESLVEKADYLALQSEIKANKDCWIKLGMGSEHSNFNRMIQNLMKSNKKQFDNKNTFEDVMNELIELAPWHKFSMRNFLEIEYNFEKYYITSLEKDDRIEVFIFSGSNGINMIYKIIYDDLEDAFEFGAELDAMIFSLKKDGHRYYMDMNTLRRGHDLFDENTSQKLIESIITEYTRCLTKFDFDFNKIKFTEYYSIHGSTITVKDISNIGKRTIDTQIYTAKEIAEVMAACQNEEQWYVDEMFTSLKEDGLFEYKVVISSLSVTLSEITTDVESYDSDVKKELLRLIKKHDKPSVVVTKFSYATPSISQHFKELGINTFIDDSVELENEITYCDLQINGQYETSLTKCLMKYSDDQLKYVGKMIAVNDLDKKVMIRKIKELLSMDQFLLLLGTLPESSYDYFVEHMLDSYVEEEEQLIVTKSLQEKALLFEFFNENKYTYVIPDEVKVSYNLLDKNALDVFRHNYMMISDYLYACAHLYGIVPIDKVIDWLLEDIDIDVDELMGLIGLFNAQYSYAFVEGDLLMTEYYLEEPELMQLILNDKPYYRPSVEELLRYKDQSYIEDTVELKLLKGFFKKHYTLKENQLDDIILTICIEAEEGNLESLFHGLKLLKIEIDETILDEFMVRYRDFSNNFRMKINHGYTSNELRSQMRTKNKIGRNEPCPCGSGKKYKKCCGKN